MIRKSASFIQSALDSANALIDGGTTGEKSQRKKLKAVVMSLQTQFETYFSLEYQTFYCFSSLVACVHLCVQACLVIWLIVLHA